MTIIKIEALCLQLKSLCPLALFHYRDQIPEGFLIHPSILHLAVVVLPLHLLNGALPCPVSKDGGDHVVISQVNLRNAGKRESTYLSLHVHVRHSTTLQTLR